MAQNKTTFTAASPREFILTSTQGQKQQDALTLLNLYNEVTGLPAMMYGPSIIGFGRYEYRYPSGHGGDAPIAGFSPRKDSLVLYIGPFEGRETLLEKLGKHKEGKVCVYVKKLADVDLDVVREMVEKSTLAVKKKYSL